VKGTASRNGISFLQEVRAHSFFIKRNQCKLSVTQEKGVVRIMDRNKMRISTRNNKLKAFLIMDKNEKQHIHALPLRKTMAGRIKLKDLTLSKGGNN
jgi:hypothetical protein